MYKKIILIGMRGSGKSHFGSCLASELKWAKIDMDDEIEKIAHKKVSRIIETQGWDTFRDMEHDVSVQVSNLENVIVSTGGGAITFERNREYLLKDSLVVFLFASFDDLLNRLQGDTGRPSLTEKQSLGEEMKQVWADRKDIYFECADIVFRAQDLGGQNARENVELNAHILADKIKKIL